MNKLPAPLILASTSPSRRELLSHLNLPFQTHKPDIDESRIDEEPAHQLVERLAVAKARTATTRFSKGLVVGADQVCIMGGNILGKPGNHETARQQLRHASGQTIEFLTGLCLYDIEPNRHQSLVAPFKVTFRELSNHQIESYLHTDKPYQCTGSFKSEGLGITLFKKLSGDDPSSLTGLPLIKLVTMFKNWDIDILSAQPGIRAA